MTLKKVYVVFLLLFSCGLSDQYVQGEDLGSLLQDPQHLVKMSIGELARDVRRFAPETGCGCRPPELPADLQDEIAYQQKVEEEARALSLEIANLESQRARQNVKLDRLLMLAEGRNPELDALEQEVKQMKDEEARIVRGDAIKAVELREMITDYQSKLIPEAREMGERRKKRAEEKLKEELKNLADINEKLGLKQAEMRKKQPDFRKAMQLAKDYYDWDKVENFASLLNIQIRDELKPRLGNQVSRGNAENVKKLLELGASVNGTVTGYSPLALAQTLGHPALVQLLTRAECPLQTPWGAEPSRVQVVRALENQHSRVRSFCFSAGCSTYDKDYLSFLRCAIDCLGQHSAATPRAANSPADYPRLSGPGGSR